MSIDNGWLRALAALAAVATLAAFLSDASAGRLHWRLP